MGSRKKQEDKHLKILRDLVAQPQNKKCFDCGQRGPTYVNMTIGAFVCTSCSGLLYVFYFILKLFFQAHMLCYVLPYILD